MLQKIKKYLPLIITVLLIPVIIAAGTLIFNDKQYAFISLAVSALALVQFFLSFEKKEKATTRLVIIAVMTALSVAGRMIFAMIPGFKPVTALVIITALYFGKEAGFITGALSAVLSNFYFGQGPWTPFQMLTWGLIGWCAGALAKTLADNKILLSVFGFLAGISFSLLMDIWSTIWLFNSFKLSAYMTALTASLPFAAVYAVSNVVFLLILTIPIGKKLERIKNKYGI